MVLICPACGVENNESADTCFDCGRALDMVIKRGSVIASRYEILSPLGKGGMGMVYKAHDRDLEETVAIKVLRPDVARSTEMARRFRSEIRLARKVRHRNVCGIHEYGQDGDLRFIAMEFIEGADLRQVLRATGSMAPLEALGVAIQLAEGLQAIHEVGIVHRDLKTPNIMRDAKGVIRLMDFGIAKEIDSDRSATATGMILGTPEYMSPEQARGQKIDTRSDIYALGIVIFELFTGNVPFRGATPVATILKHLQEPPPLEGPMVERIPQGVRDILRRALAKEPGQRHQTAEILAHELRQERTRLFPDASPTPVAMALQDPTPAAVQPPRPSERSSDLSTPVPSRQSDAREAPTIPDPRAVTATGSSPAMRRPVGTAATVAEDLRVSGARRRQAQRALTTSAAGKGRGLWALGATAGLLMGGAAALYLWGVSPEPMPTTANPPPVMSEPVGATTPVAPTVAPTEAPAAPVTRPVPPPVRSAPTESPLEATRRSARSPVPVVGSTPLPSPRVASPPQSSPIPIAHPSAIEEPTASSAPQVDAVPPPTTIRLPPPTTEPPAVSSEPGMLHVTVTPWANISVDGTPRGVTPLPDLSLSPGPHKVELRHPAFEALERSVTIRSGETQGLRVDFKAEGVPKKGSSIDSGGVS